MIKIIAISGTKNSGKTTLCNYIKGTTKEDLNVIHFYNSYEEDKAEYINQVGLNNISKGALETFHFIQATKYLNKLFTVPIDIENLIGRDTLILLDSCLLDNFMEFQLDYDLDNYDESYKFGILKQQVLYFLNNIDGIIYLENTIQNKKDNLIDLRNSELNELYLKFLGENHLSHCVIDSNETIEKKNAQFLEFINKNLRD